MWVPSHTRKTSNTCFRSICVSKLCMCALLWADVRFRASLASCLMLPGMESRPTTALHWISSFTKWIDAADQLHSLILTTLVWPFLHHCGWTPVIIHNLRVLIFTIICITTMYYSAYLESCKRTVSSNFCNGNFCNLYASNYPMIWGNIYIKHEFVVFMRNYGNFKEWLLD